MLFLEEQKTGPEVPIDLNKWLVPHPATTFYARMEHDAAPDLGAAKDDILVIDKSLTPSNGDLVVCYTGSDFTLMRFPSDARYSPEHPPEFFCWGTVTYIIHATRNVRPAGLQ